MVDGNRIVAGVTIGDINGVGPEIILKLFSDTRILDLCVPVVYGSLEVLSEYKKILGLRDFPFTPISAISEVKKNTVNVIDCMTEKVRIDTGKPTIDGSRMALAALDAAVKDVRNGVIDVVVTAPLNKMNIQQLQDDFTGHTGHLSKLDGKEGLMVLIAEKMRIAMVTGHIPFSDVAHSIKTDVILRRIKQLNNCLSIDFGINRPRIAVLALNPHAGENGLLGQEEGLLIEPAINQAKTLGINASGPFPADGFFGSGNYLNFDATMAMYHDQALLPFKSLYFDSGVNFTSGLSFIRTSPDHGTAYEIAGTGRASERSMKEALYLACDVFMSRQRNAAKHHDK